MADTLTLSKADYCVTAVLLLIPLGIGVFYAWKDSKRVNRTEYLLGGRRLGMLPVAMSIFASFQSAVAITGAPSDLFDNGPMIWVLYLTIGLAYGIACFTAVPLLYPLKLTSIYEYLEMRYKSKAVRLISTCIGMFQTYCYMIIALLAPGLAVQAVAGIPFWMSVVLVGLIGTFYTAIGGIKSVVWTDVYQSGIMCIGVFLLIAKGTIAVGGIDNVWRIASDGGRTNFNSFNLDPRTRHTWWGLVIGISFNWMTNIYGQSCLQRTASMKSLKSAKLCYLINLPLNAIWGFFLLIIGVTMYAYFYTMRCSPFEAGLISNRNQIVPFFMMHVFQDSPGLSGLFMATIFSGALSTLSSGMNSLAANTVEDVLARCLVSVSERTATVLTKAFVFLYGFSIIGVTYLAKSLKGPVTQLGVSAFGACGSAVLGMFILGSSVPWANKYGAISGGAVTLIINLWIAIGGHLFGKKIKHLAPVPSDQCYRFLNDSQQVSNPERLYMVSETYDVNNSSIAKDNTSSVFVGSQIPAVTDNDHAYSHFFYDLSYEWYALTGVIICMVVGLIVSFFTASPGENKTEPRLILPFLRRFWSFDEVTEPPEEDELCQKMSSHDNVKIRDANPCGKSKRSCYPYSHWIKRVA